MSLATRCTQCGTVFRVVEDQLKVSEGWVRCGRCNEVFNALEGLFDLDRDAPPEWTPPGERAASAEAGPPGGVVEPAAPAAAVADSGLVDQLDAALRRRRDEPAPPVARRPAARPPAPRPADDAELPVVEPEFVRRAVARDRWRRSPRRAALAATVAVLLALLALQWVHHFRDTVAARAPVLAPLLAASCRLLGCTLQPPRRIDAIAVEASALARAGGPDRFRLSVTLRNRDTIALLLPAVELSLTDGSGQLVSRRVLAPADFRVAAPVIAAGAEQTLSLTLLAAGGRVSGYTVEIFYP